MESVTVRQGRFDEQYDTDTMPMDVPLDRDSIEKGLCSQWRVVVRFWSSRVFGNWHSSLVIIHVFERFSLCHWQIQLSHAVIYNNMSVWKKLWHVNEAVEGEEWVSQRANTKFHENLTKSRVTCHARGVSPKSASLLPHLQNIWFLYVWERWVALEPHRQVPLYRREI